jgi:hypothetical protein
MVAAVTHMTPDEILWHLSAARGLQYQAIWLVLQGNTVESLAAGGQITTNFREIAGL